MTSIGGYVEERIGTGGFYITAMVRPDRKPEAVEAAIYEEIARIAAAADRRLGIAKGPQRHAVGLSCKAFAARRRRATILGYLHGRCFAIPDLINTRLQKINAVTREDVQRVAKKYLQCPPAAPF